MNSKIWVLTRTFTKIFLRDRQAIMFMVFFPIMFMLALGLGSEYRPGPQTIGLHIPANNADAAQFVELLQNAGDFIFIQGSEQELKNKLQEKVISILVILPDDFSKVSSSTQLQVEIDSSQSRQVWDVLASFKEALNDVERGMRETSALFKLQVEDIQPRTMRYIDFLLPGILAMTLMQISIAGSGFNLVEYRRKGILKRLFVTPLNPRDFIVSVVLARLLLCLVQISVLIAIAVFALDVDIVGNIFSLYFIVILGSIIFLCIGFTLGSIAKTQQAIQAFGNLVIFPQMLFSGIFYPIDSLPDLLQPLATMLPLSFIASALREIATNGMGLLDIIPNLAGITVWLILGFVMSTRLFVWKEVAT